MEKTKESVVHIVMEVDERTAIASMGTMARIETVILNGLTSGM